MKRGERGFTLIELMIVVAIIGILAAVAIPNFMNARDRAKIATAASVMGSLRTALEMYMTDESIYPITSVEATFETVLAPYMTNFGIPENSNWGSYEEISSAGDYSVLVQCKDRIPITCLFVRDDSSDIWIANDTGPILLAAVPLVLPSGSWSKYVK